MVKSVQTTFGSRNWPGKFAQKAVADLSNSKALASVLLLEGSVLTGRCYHAQKRGGYVELRERFIEEFLTGIVWLFGITSLNKVGNFVAKKFNFDTTIDVGKDKISEEYGKLKDHFKSPLERFTDGKSKRFKDILSRVKFSKIILCTLTGIYVVGSMIPKYKNSVTENDKKNQGQKGFAAALTGVFEDKFAKKQAQKTTNSDSFSMQKFLETAKNSSTNFKGGLNLVSLSHNLENNNIYKILTMDAGIIGGRSINSRNEDEKYEIVLRDVCSIYFYMASTHHISHFLSDDKFNFFGKKNATGLNLDKRMGVSTNLDPRIAEYLNNQILKEFDTTSKSKEGFNYEKFMTGIFGKEQPDLVKILKHEAETQKEKHTLNLDNFLKILEDHSYENIDFIRRNAKNAAKLNNQLITGSGVMRIARHLEELKTDKQVAEQLKILPGDTIEVKRLKKLPELFLKASDMLYKHTANGKEIHSVSNKIIIKMIDDLAKLNLSINNEKLRKLHKEEMDIVAKFKEEHLKQV
jgi:hypothetical protein